MMRYILSTQAPVSSTVPGTIEMMRRVPISFDRLVLRNPGTVRYCTDSQYSDGR